MSLQDPKQFQGVMATAQRLFEHGQTDGASIVTLFFEAGEYPPPEIMSDQEAMHALSEAETTRLVQKIGGLTSTMPN